MRSHGYSSDPGRDAQAATPGDAGRPGDPKEFHDPISSGHALGLGTRFLVWVALLFLITLVLFVGMDMHHEAEVLRKLEVPAETIDEVRRQTLALHAWHALVTIAVFGLGIFLAIYRPILRRFQRLLRAIHHFRLGIWRVKLPRGKSDEIQYLETALSDLGPHLERTFLTFVESDRRATVVRLSAAYDKQVSPLAQRLLSVSSLHVAQEDDPIWVLAQQLALRILQTVEDLGNPEHPAVAGIVEHSFPKERSSLLSSEPQDRGGDRA